jgi:NADPH2:quinone reductase
MRAIRQHEFGPPDRLVLEELPDLTPASGQVRIAVEASGVHLLDTTIRRGDPGPLPSPELPTIPGWEEQVDGVTLVYGGVGRAALEGRRALGKVVLTSSQ